MEEFHERMEKIAEQMCDKYCKYPEQIADDELLMIRCSKCPINEFVKGGLNGNFRKSN